MVDSRAAASRAGTLYLAVTLSNGHGKTHQVPYELAVDVSGTVRGKPTYEKAGPTPDPTTTPSPTGSPSPAAAAKPDDGSTASNPVGWTIGGVGAVVVLSAGTALSIRLVR